MGLPVETSVEGIRARLEWYERCCHKANTPLPEANWHYVRTLVDELDKNKERIEKLEQAMRESMNEEYPTSAGILRLALEEA